MKEQETEGEIFRWIWCLDFNHGVKNLRALGDGERAEDCQQDGDD